MGDQESRFQQIKLFAGLSSEALQKLDAAAWSVTAADGELILLEGDKETPVFFILQGTVRVFHSNPEGREQTLILMNPGETFNHATVFSESTLAAAMAVAVGPVRLLAMTPADFRSIVSETPEIALAVLRDFAVKLHHLTAVTHDLSLRSVRGRLARFLLLQAQAASPAVVRWTQDEIAAQVGTVREVVSRILRAFVKEGLVKMERQRITVLDAEALQREAEF